MPKKTPIVENMKIKELNLKQERFCQNYVGGSSSTFGNEVWSYIDAYRKDLPRIPFAQMTSNQLKDYNKHCAQASNTLSIPKVRERCNELLDKLINNETADRELQKVIMQDNELPAKVAAIKEYNNLRNRIKQLGDKENPIYFKPITDIFVNGIQNNNSDKKDSEVAKKD